MAEQQPEANSRTILIAIDGSTGCDQAFEWVSKKIHKKGDLILCIHVTPLPDARFPYNVATSEYNLKLEKHEVEMKKLEKKYTEKCLENHMHAKIKVFGGDKPGEKICEHAKDEKTDMIVVGSRGMGVIRRTLLGSVSEYVLHHAHIPVVVVPKK